MPAESGSRVRRPERPDWSSREPAERKKLEHKWDMLLRYGMELRPCMLGPAAAFSPDLAPLNPDRSGWPTIDPAKTGKNSGTVAFRLGMSCAGWIEQPTAQEFHEAVHAEEPDERQQTIVYTWGLESTDIELIHAFAEQAYSWRTLVTALQKAGFDVYPRIKLINDFATTGEMDGVLIWED